MRLVIFSNKAQPEAEQTTFKAPTDGPMTITVFGSAFSTIDGIPIGVKIYLDGKYGGVSQLYSNKALVHKQLTPTSFTVDLSSSPNTDHKITIEPLADSRIDNNDFFTAVIDY